MFVFIALWNLSFFCVELINFNPIVFISDYIANHPIHWVFVCICELSYEEILVVDSNTISFIHENSRVLTEIAKSIYRMVNKIDLRSSLKYPFCFFQASGLRGSIINQEVLDS